MIVRGVTKFVPLAAEIFADSTPRNAARRLRNFIATDPELLGRMREAGYDSHRTWLTPRQYYILQEYL